MRVGLIDVDRESRKKGTKVFPNLCLMKISAWHKSKGNEVEWYFPFSPRYDLVYMAKVFSDEYTAPYQFQVNADRVIKGGSGFAFGVDDSGKEIYCKEKDPDLPDEIEHMMPDYELYGIKDEAYGFLTRGCPRGCNFCHVAAMQGRRVHTVARLSEFWNGQKHIKLLDPNLSASSDWEMHIRDLAESKAYVDFTQGLDIRLLTERKIKDLNAVRFKMIHFAWDDPHFEMRPHLERMRAGLKCWDRRKVSAYVLTNFNSSFEEDLYRVNTLREFGVQPYVMIYRKSTASKRLHWLQRWCNPFIFWSVPTFDEYKNGEWKD